MELKGRVTTWLDTIVATRIRQSPVKATVHPLGQTDRKGTEPCFAVSINGRWLCSTNGRVTVLHGRKAAERFIGLLGISECRTGDPIKLEVDCSSTAHCMGLDRRLTLRTCSLQLHH